MTRKLTILFTALILMISAAGCVTVSFGNRVTGGVQGTGNMTTVNFSNDNFTKLAINIPGALYYTADETCGGRIELHENLAQYLTISTDNSTLVIDSNKDFNINSNKEMPKIYVSAPLLESVRIEGVVDIKEADKITADSFTLRVDGVFNGTLDLYVKNLDVDMSGVGDLTLNGTADNAKIDMSGVGSLRAFGLQTKETYVETSGVGDLEISCSDKLTAEISSVGGVRYKGNPAVYPNVSGVGGLKRVD